MQVDQHAGGEIFQILRTQAARAGHRIAGRHGEAASRGRRLVGGMAEAARKWVWSWRKGPGGGPPAGDAAQGAKGSGAGGPGPRSSHGVSVDGNRLFVVGGEFVARQPIDSRVYSVDLGADSDSSGGEQKPWAVVGNGEAIPSPRIAHTQAIVTDVSTGKKFMYLFGGRQGVSMDSAPLNDLWCLDMEAGTWAGPLEPSAGGDPAPGPRSFHKMVAVGEYLYVFGGCAAKGRLADLHRFNTSTRVWEALPSAPADMNMLGRGGAGFAAGSDDKNLFLVGGFTGTESNLICRYDISQRTWNMVLPEGNSVVTAFSVSCSATLPGDGDSRGGLIVFFGGEVKESEMGHEGAGNFSDRVLVIDAVTGEPDLALTEAANAAAGDARPMHRGWADADAWGKDSLVVYGGLTGDDASPTRLADTWILTRSLL